MRLSYAMVEVDAALRYTVFGLVALAALAALGSWLVRTRRVSPFGGLGRTLKSATDPILKPVERRLVRMGGNPAHAGGWLIVIIAVAGIVVISLAGWLLDTFQTVNLAAQAGPRATVALVIEIIYRILLYALIIRVIAGWFGLFRYSRWIRPAYILTDWIVEPIRRIVPTLGAFDVSPIVAWLALMLLRQLLLSMLAI
jgi:YggT family protein